MKEENEKNRIYATERMNALENFLMEYEKTDLENLYQEMFPERRKLIEPVTITDEEYVDSVMFKLNAYEKSGIYLGDKLFFTNETSKNPLSTRTPDGILRKIFCEA